MTLKQAKYYLAFLVNKMQNENTKLAQLKFLCHIKYGLNLRSIQAEDSNAWYIEGSYNAVHLYRIMPKSNQGKDRPSLSWTCTWLKVPEYLVHSCPHGNRI